MAEEFFHKNETELACPNCGYLLKSKQGRDFTGEDKTFWEKVREEIQCLVSRATFFTWFKGMELADKDDTKLTVVVPNTFIKDYVEMKYRNLLLRAVQKFDPAVVHVELTCGEPAESITAK